MINKRSSFVNSTVQLANWDSFQLASRLESELMRLAIDFSIYPERINSWADVWNIFNTVLGTKIANIKQLDDGFVSFIAACRKAYRMESSLMVEKKVATKALVDNPLILRIKFYCKRERIAFLEWKLTFDRTNGYLYQSSMSDDRRFANRS